MNTTLLLVTTLLALSTSAFTQDAPEPPETQPDLLLAKGDRIVGDDIYGSPRDPVLRLKTVGARPATFGIGVQNDSAIDDRIRVRGSRSDRHFRVIYKKDGHNITGAMVRGARIPLAAGEAARISARVQATARTKGRSAKKRFG